MDQAYTLTRNYFYRMIFNAWYNALPEKRTPVLEELKRIIQVAEFQALATLTLRRMRQRDLEYIEKLPQETKEQLKLRLGK